MKKIVALFMLIFVLLFSAACTDKSQPHTWKDDFMVSHTTHEEMNFSSEQERLEAILNGVAVLKHDNYVVKNKSDVNFRKIYLVFTITAANEQSVEYKESIVGILKSGETKNLNIFYSQYEAAMDGAGIDYSDGYMVELNSIEYEQISK